MMLVRMPQHCKAKPRTIRPPRGLSSTGAPPAGLTQRMELRAGEKERARFVGTPKASVKAAVALGTRLAFCLRRGRQL